MLPRRAGRLDQTLDRPAVADGLADKQVLGDARGCARLLGEQFGGAAVALRALRARELHIDPVAHDGMHERQRPAGLEDPRGRQQIGCSGCLELVEACVARRQEQAALLENRQRSRELPGMLREPAEPEANGATDRAYSAADASLAHRLDELAQEEWRPARHAQARVDEAGIGSPTESRLQELDNGDSRQRSELEHTGGRIGGHDRQQLGISGCLAGSDRHDERHVKFFEPRQQERQVTEGRGVCPMRVVDEEAKRLDGGQVRAEPVKAVEDRERGIEAQRGRTVCGWCARKPQQTGRDAGGAVQEIGALVLRCVNQRRLEELTHDPEGEVALEFGSPRTEHAHSALCRCGSRRREQSRLADPRRPFKDDEGAAPGASLGQRGLDPRQLLAPFEELPGGRGLFHVPLSLRPWAGKDRGVATVRTRLAGSTLRQTHEILSRPRLTRPLLGGASDEHRLGFRPRRRPVRTGLRIRPRTTRRRLRRCSCRSQRPHRPQTSSHRPLPDAARRRNVARARAPGRTRGLDPRRRATTWRAAP